MEKKKFNTGRLVCTKVYIHGSGDIFSERKILERIDKIQTMKEDLSLDELANMFSPSVREILLTKEDILRKGIASEPVLQFFIEQTNKTAEFQFVDILYVYMLEELLQSGEISLEEGKNGLASFK